MTFRVIAGVGVLQRYRGWRDNETILGADNRSVLFQGNEPPLMSRPREGASEWSKSGLRESLGEKLRVEG